MDAAARPSASSARDRGPSRAGRPARQLSKRPARDEARSRTTVLRDVAGADVGLEVDAPPGDDAQRRQDGERPRSRAAACAQCRLIARPRRGARTRPRRRRCAAARASQCAACDVLRRAARPRGRGRHDHDELARVAVHLEGRRARRRTSVLLRAGLGVHPEVRAIASVVGGGRGRAREVDPALRQDAACRPRGRRAGRAGRGAPSPARVAQTSRRRASCPAASNSARSELTPSGAASSRATNARRRPRRRRRAPTSRRGSGSCRSSTPSACRARAATRASAAAAAASSRGRRRGAAATKLSRRRRRRRWRGRSSCGADAHA